jgi:hypothetical protein
VAKPLVVIQENIGSNPIYHPKHRGTIMSEYKPDKWVIAKIIPKNGEILYKVLGTWYGGYLGGDSWRLNSGITEIKKNGQYWDFYGHSGSKYHCHKDTTGMSNYTRSIVDKYTIELRSRFDASFEILSKKEMREYISNA